MRNWQSLAASCRIIPTRIFIAARIDRRQNRWDSALANFQKANDLDPRNGEFAVLARGGLFLTCAATPSMEQLIKKCAASGTFKGPTIQNWLAKIKLAQGDPVAAQSLLEQVPLDFSPTPEIWDTRFMQPSTCAITMWRVG